MSSQKFIGRQLAVGLGKELIRGTAVSPAYWLHATSFSYNDKVIKAIEDGFTGGIWAGDQSFITQKWADGNIEFDITADSFGLILLATFGGVSSASHLGARKHTYSLVNSSTHQSLTMSTADPIGKLQFPLTMVDRLEIDILPQEIIKCSAEFRSRASISGSDSSAFGHESKFLGRHLDFRIADETGDLNSAEKILVRSLKLTIEKNTELYDVIGTVQPDDVINKNIAITGEFELALDSYEWKNLIMDGSYKAMRIKLENTDSEIGTTHPTFLIDLSKVEFNTWEPDYPLNELVSQRITFSALFDLGGNDNLFNDCYVINEVTNY